MTFEDRARDGEPVLTSVAVAVLDDYVTTGTYARFYSDAVEDIAAFLRGAPVRVLDG